MGLMALVLVFALVGGGTFYTDVLSLALHLFIYVWCEFIIYHKLRLCCVYFFRHDKKTFSKLKLLCEGNSLYKNTYIKSKISIFVTLLYLVIF
ncbi:MAG: hypothetical protein K0R69_2713 [Clostridia bacterium]|jgi:hypothetical protein|nr:hypothetical protein [Clostridia bacterium]